MNTTLLRTRDQLTNVIPISSGHPYTWQRIYTVPVDVRSGDLLHVESMFQATAPFDHAVMCGRYLLLTDVETAAAPGAGIQIVRPHTRNIFRTVHHDPVWMSGSLRIETSGLRFVTVVGYAASTAAQPGDTLTINAYGQVCATIFREGQSQLEDGGGSDSSA